MDLTDINEADDSMGDDVILLSDEFSLAKDKIPLLEENKDRIEVLFDVEIDYGLTALEGQMQWVTVSGEDENRAKARDYVRALCNPVDTSSITYPPALHPFLSRAHVHEKLEKQSRAVILFPAVGTVVIQGNDALAVTLALSAVEDLITKYENEQTPNPDAVRSPSTKQASLRLESELRRLSSENRSIEYDEDYSKLPDAVKRTLLGWLQEANTQGEGLATMADLQQATEEISETTPLRNRGSNHTRDVISHSVSEDPTTDPTMQKYWDLGREKGYADKDICSVLRVFGSQLDDDEFVLALETQTGIQRKYDDTSGLNATSKNPMEEVLDEQAPNVTKRNTGKKKSPRKRNKSKEGSTDAYLQLLSRDFAEEGHEMDIDGFKERSAQRIQLLHQALDMEPVITDVRINHKDNDADDQNEDGIAVDDRDDTDWKVVPDHKRGRRGGNMPYNKPKTFNEPDSQQNYGNSHQSQVAQLDDFGDFMQHNRLDFSPRRGGNLSPRGNQSPTRQSRGKRGRSPSRQSPARPPPGHLRQGRNSPSRRGSPPQYTSQPPPQFRLDSRNAAGSASLSLRYIIIDGSNVAMSHSNGRCFSCRGIKICVDYFLKRGHQEITVFVPQWRTQAPKPGYEIEEQHILSDLKQKGHLVFTPARRVPGKNIVCYDDRFIIKLAIETDGIIVSNDNYRDLWWENVDYRNIIENRLLPYSFVKDLFMPPDDPLGRDGPHLSQFLTKMDEDNYRFVNDQAVSSNRGRGWQHARGRGAMNYPPQPGGANYQMPPPGGMNYQPQPINRGRGIMPVPTNQMGRGLLPAPTNQATRGRGAALRQMAPQAFPNSANQFNSGQQTSTQNQKSPSKQPNRKWLRAQLLNVFPDNVDVVDQVLRFHSKEHNLNKLSSYILEKLGQ